MTDLSGSERNLTSKNTGAKMYEGGNINKSILALSNCIISLAESDKKNSYVPWRNSKLTRLLKVSY